MTIYIYYATMCLFFEEVPSTSEGVNEMEARKVEPTGWRHRVLRYVLLSFHPLDLSEPGWPKVMKARAVVIGTIPLAATVLIVAAWLISRVA